jgi:succinate dehydrogenase/fumarate reductase flavoprotein subunit
MQVPTTQTTASVAGVNLPVYSVNTLVIGSGAAGLNAALQLVAHGQRDVMLVTERWGAGTSNEAGSDKQTYYKLALAHGMTDSPRQMAEDFFNGGGMHGDIALCEAQHSAQAFYHLVSLGVPFPHDQFGAYVGYRTDHDPRGRATSAGPMTSHLMCERLGDALRKEGISVLDDHQVIALLTRETHAGKSVCGAIAIDKRGVAADCYGLVLFNAVNVILATGGPGGMYRASVYPESQVGSTGLALAVGAVAQNLTESQFGLASVGFRWNVSGSYQQAIPRYVSTDADGGEQREFLNDHFPDTRTLATAIFRKGYEWPFDCTKVRNHGSSLIDILVYQETAMRDRRVFLDFTRNPTGTLSDFSLEGLEKEARTYLENSRALLPTPIQRLEAMNKPALDVYCSHGIDLTRDLLEIAVCAQHNNGGLKGNIWWESNIRHLFPVGEVNGSHGVYRPGGAALNAGQVGGLRAALFISKRYSQPPPDIGEFSSLAAPQVQECLDFARRVAANAGGRRLLPQEVAREIQERMTASASIVRDRGRVAQATQSAWRLYMQTQRNLAVASLDALPAAFRAIDLCLTHVVYLEALREYLERGGKSRGSCLVLDPGGELPAPALGDEWRFALPGADDFSNRKILEIYLDEAFQVRKHWVDVRPIPKDEGWFETVWSDYLHDRVVREEARG